MLDCAQFTKISYLQDYLNINHIKRIDIIFKFIIPIAGIHKARKN